MQSSGFFNGDHAYGEQDFNRYFANIYESGVSVDNNNKMTMEVAAKAGGVSVKPGFAIIKGYFLYLDAAKDFTINKPSVGTQYYRMLITLDANVNNSSMNLNLKSGSDKEGPEVDKNGNELSLALIKIDDKGTITVKDERYDTALCGAIRPKNISSYKTMIAGFESQFNVWMAGMQNKVRDVFVQSTAPKESVSGSIWIDTSVQ